MKQRTKGHTWRETTTRITRKRPLPHYGNCQERDYYSTAEDCQERDYYPTRNSQGSPKERQLPIYPGERLLPVPIIIFISKLPTEVFVQFMPGPSITKTYFGKEGLIFQHISGVFGPGVQML